MSSPISPASYNVDATSLEHDDIPSPAYSRFPVHFPDTSMTAVMSPLEPVVTNPFQSMQSGFGRFQEEASPHDPVRSVKASAFNYDSHNTAESSHHDGTPECNSAIADLTNAAKHVKSLSLRPDQVAVIKDLRHELNITQIYDHQGNEISYTFGGSFSQFKLEYELDKPPGTDESSEKARWRIIKKWRNGFIHAMKRTSKGSRRYEVETWKRKM